MSSSVLMIGSMKLRLNPYSDGIYSMSISNLLNMAKIKCLNPYSDGIYSMSYEALCPCC